MKLIRLLCFVALSELAQGGSGYKMLDIGECILPISKRLIQTNDENNFIEKDYKMQVKYPMAITIDKKKNITKASYEKIVAMLKLNEAIVIAGFKGLRGESLNNLNTLIILNQHMMLFTNYPQNEMEYMLEYCRKTAK